MVARNVSSRVRMLDPRLAASGLTTLEQVLNLPESPFQQVHEGASRIYIRDSKGLSEIMDLDTETVCNTWHSDGHCITLNFFSFLLF